MINLYTIYIVLSPDMVIQITERRQGRTMLIAKTLSRTLPIVALVVVVHLTVQPVFADG
jgi:hypothetical protein